MKHDLLLSNIARHISLDKEETEYFISLLSSRTLKKKNYLLEAGQPCTTISYVNEGFLRAYYRDADDNETTIMFAVADWWITDMTCFVNQTLSITSIEAIEDTSVFQLTKENMERLFIKVPKFERFFRILMQNSYVREQSRVLQTLSLPAEERYTAFLKKYPSIAGRLTQKQIASYLGITPEFLSVIRKNISKGNVS